MMLIDLPCWGLPIDDVIATRLFEIADADGGSHSLEARLGRPIALSATSGYCCPLQIDGLGVSNPKWYCAEDAVTALRNALTALDAEICIIECNLWYPQPSRSMANVGVREVPTLRELWQAWVSQADYGKAVNLAVPLAEAGIAFGQKVLGFAKLFGKGAPVDIPEAILWLQRAAGQGEADACDTLANFYFSGNHVPQTRHPPRIPTRLSRTRFSAPGSRVLWSFPPRRSGSG